MIGADMRYLLGERSLRSLSALPGRRAAAGILASDVEGPLFLGDFIAEALSARVRPRHYAVDATPSYGHILYQEGYAAFSEATAGLRRPHCRNGCAQEGTDTIFALPMLLACGADAGYLDLLARRSAPTPGAARMLAELDRMGMMAVGITTAPQQPYRNLVAASGLLPRERILGSPFPLNEAAELLRVHRRWDEEIGAVNRYLDDAFAIIDGYAEIYRGADGQIRRLSDCGRQLLQARFIRHCRDELGISHDPAARRRRTAPTLLGEIIEACAMMGDRSKAATALNLGRSLRGGQPLVAMGDGGNDAEMLRRVPLSIGVNGPEAASAAKIGVVTADMACVLPILRQMLLGERDIDAIIVRAQAEVGDAALIHRGGGRLAPALLARHREMKRQLRGAFVTF